MSLQNLSQYCVNAMAPIFQHIPDPKFILLRTVQAGTTVDFRKSLRAMGRGVIPGKWAIGAAGLGYLGSDSSEFFRWIAFENEAQIVMFKLLLPPHVSVTFLEDYIEGASESIHWNKPYCEIYEGEERLFITTA